MAILKRICIALIVGGLLVAVAAIVALVVGTSTRFFQGCAVIAVGCVFVFFVLAGRGPFGYDYPYRKQLHRRLSSCLRSIRLPRRHRDLGAPAARLCAGGRPAGHRHRLAALCGLAAEQAHRADRPGEL